MSKTQRRKRGSKRNMRKSRKGGFFKMPTADSLKKSMADGAAKANAQYEKGKKAAAPHAAKLQKNVITGLEKAGKQTKSVYKKAKYSSPTAFVAAKTAEGTYSKGKKATQATLGKAKEMGSTFSTKGRDYYNKSFGNKEALEAANRSQRGVAQSNFQYGGPGLIATGNPTMPV